MNGIYLDQNRKKW